MVKLLTVTVGSIHFSAQ